MEISIATSVRRAQLSDTTALTDLVNRAYAIEAFFVEGDRTTADEIAALIQTGGFYVLDHADGIAAAVLFQGPGQRDGLPPTHAYFGMLSVLPELQGKGIGRRLVQAVEEMAAATGATSMSLRVISLREELRRWYGSLGYHEVGTAPYRRTVKLPCHFIEMAKPLAPAASLSSGNAHGAS